jgi:ubiquinone biosynthesis protein UbiJ
MVWQAFLSICWPGRRAYNLPMIRAFQKLLGAALAARICLLVNHVLQSEVAAVDRLQRHSGKRIQVHLLSLPVADWLPEVIGVEITRAGLIEWLEAFDGEPDLRVSIDASNPARSIAQAFGGQRPSVDVSGDAALAADVGWLVDNLRWDLHDDLARVVGDAPAAALAQFAAAASSGLRVAVDAMVDTARRLRRMTQGEADGPGFPPR